MSFPPPIIPQTAEQAIARDQIAGLDAVRLDDPRAELERLRQAIRDHRETLTTAGALTGEFSDEDMDRMGRKAEADLKLWAHLGESA